MKSRVALAECENYEPGNVYRAVAKAVDLLGGTRSIVKSGNRVLIKPNLLSASPPESAVDTHPEVLRAVIRLTREAGGLPQVGDSPGGAVKKMSHVYETSGIKKVCDEEGVKIVSFDRARKIEGIPIALAPSEADVFISLPKFKTHCLMVLTGAVKNIFGVVPGLFKTQCHRMAPHPVPFAKLLVDIYSYAPPHLTILDGVVAMEGEGPGSAGTPREIGLIAASTDAVSLDAVLATIVGLEPFDIPTTKEADRRSLGEGHMENIEILGDRLNQFIQSGFRLPKTTVYQRIPNWLMRLVGRLMRLMPSVRTDRCTKCMLCVRSCPAKAISEKNGRIRFDYEKCILCLCCHEFCPEEAIFIRENLLTRIIRT